MKNKTYIQRIKEAFAIALILLFSVLFWQIVTVSDTTIETNAIEILDKYFDKKQVVKK